MVNSPAGIRISTAPSLSEVLGELWVVPAADVAVGAGVSVGCAGAALGAAVAVACGGSVGAGVALAADCFGVGAAVSTGWVGVAAGEQALNRRAKSKNKLNLMFVFIVPLL